MTIQERMEHYEEETWPEFYRIALELAHLDELSGTGWWGNWGGCMYAETAIRAFGGIVADAALACENGDEGSCATTSVALLERMDCYLDWQSLVPSSEDDVAQKLIETARAALDAVRLHLLAKAEPAAQQ